MAWALLQLADSAFPSNGFAHSAGLEAAMHAGHVRTRRDLVDFVEQSLDQVPSPPFSRESTRPHVLVHLARRRRSAGAAQRVRLLCLWVLQHSSKTATWILPRTRALLRDPSIDCFVRCDQAMTAALASTPIALRASITTGRALVASAGIAT